MEHSSGLEHWQVIAICLLNGLGFMIFRGSNGEKDAFRRDPHAPEVAHLEYLNTKRGTRLLVTGWWGMARKINYTGDWVMGLSWCAITGFNTTLTFFYAIYFAILLIHRSLRSVLPSVNDRPECALEDPDWSLELGAWSIPPPVGPSCVWGGRGVLLPVSRRLPARCVLTCAQ